jgi:hypothetical protein
MEYNLEGYRDVSFSDVRSFLNPSSVSEVGKMTSVYPQSLRDNCARRARRCCDVGIDRRQSWGAFSCDFELFVVYFPRERELYNIKDGYRKHRFKRVSDCPRRDRIVCGVVLCQRDGVDGMDCGLRKGREEGEWEMK